MHRLRHLILTFFMMASALVVKAQENELELGLRAGDNSALGGFAAVSLETVQTFRNDFSISGGVQYNTIGRTSLEARPSYIFDFTWGRLSPEVLIAYTHLASVNCLAAGAGACVDFGRWSGKLGYYYRLYGGNGGRITEPFNLYYQISVNLLEKAEKWDLDLSMTNNEIFELERHYLPSFIAECFYYPTSRMGISLGIGCKPAGMFHMSADYYQSYIKSGICYRW